MEQQKPLGFKSAEEKAKKIVEDISKVPVLLEEAVTKAEKHKGALSEVLADLFTLIRLIRAWAAGKNKNVSWQTIVIIIAAVVYFVNPFDVLPDVIPLLGFLDDAAVVGFVLKSVASEIAKFRQWEHKDGSEEERGEL